MGNMFALIQLIAGILWLIREIRETREQSRRLRASEEPTAEKATVQEGGSM